MQYKLEKFVKFWPSIDKWVVSYTAPEFEYISDNAFHKDLDKADKEAMENIRKRIKFQLELKANGTISQSVIDF